MVAAGDTRPAWGPPVPGVASVPIVVCCLVHGCGPRGRTAAPDRQPVPQAGHRSSVTAS